MLETSCLRMPLIAATANATIGAAVKWMNAGAADYIEKPYCRVSLIDALSRAWCDSDKIEAQPISPWQGLTIRQRAVLHLVAKGRHNREIAEEMSLSIRTVEMHRARLMKSLGVRTTAEAIMLVP